MRLGLGAHKRKTRRITREGSTRRGRSVSPRATPYGHPQPAPLVPGPRKASTAPSSPVNSSTLAVAAAAGDSPAGKALDDLPRNTYSSLSQQQGTAVEAANGRAPDGALGGAPPTAPPEPRHQQSGETTMGTIFTEWFHKIFAPTDAVGSGGAGGEAQSASKPATGTGDENGGAVSDGLGTAAGASSSTTKDYTEVPSNKTSLASDIRPPSPTQLAANAGSALTSAGIDEQRALATSRESEIPPSGHATSEEAAPTEESAPTEEASAASSAIASSGGASVGVSTRNNGAKGVSVDQESNAPTVSPRFLGLFPRGFGGGANANASSVAGDKAGKEMNANTNSNTETAQDTDSKEKDSTSEGKSISRSIVSEASDGSNAGGTNEITGNGTGNPTKLTFSGEARRNAGADREAQPKTDFPRNGDASKGATGASVAKATAAGGEHGVDVVSAEQSDRGAAQEGTASAAARHGGSGGPTSPGRAAALSVGSDADDGEEEHLYTAGTHSGARPSIDDFSSLRVLGKGSYGKVRILRLQELLHPQLNEQHIPSFSTCSWIPFLEIYRKEDS